VPSLSSFQVLNCVHSFSECSQRMPQALRFWKEESKWARQSSVPAQVPAHWVLPSGTLQDLAEGSWNQAAVGQCPLLSARLHGGLSDSSQHDGCDGV